jgi:DNA polymerase-1
LRIIRTETLRPEALARNEALWAYNGLDCCVTYEVFDALRTELTPVTAATYAFSRALQGPILEMNSRGLRVDEDRRQSVLASYRMDTIKLTNQLDYIIREGIYWDYQTKNRKYKWPSDMQLKELFYKVMGLPPIYKRNAAGERVLTVERDALEKIGMYFHAGPIVKHILALRDLQKKMAFLSTSVDTDGRLRTSFNIAGTTTGRLASSYSDFGTGTNLQNVENRLRSVFIADPGYKFCNIDLEQGDSRGVGAIHWNTFRDGSYLDACESGDLHTTVARAAFRNLPWTGNMDTDRSIAKGKFYRAFSYRDAAKRLGHGSNYQGQPEKMSRATHIPIQDVQTFQREYLAAFPAFQLWWRYVGEQLRDVRKLTTLMGRQRYFFGHWKDSETVRAAIAYEPQSITADTIDRGLLALWRANRVQLLLQVHDSILFQFPEELEDEIVPWALETIAQPLALRGGRTFVIPGEAKVGWNWSDSRDDPDSLRKYTDAKRPSKRGVT